MSFATPHRRLNQLTGEWVLVSPQRMDRPWQGHVERAPVRAAAAYDPQCYLCPGNLRANGERNPAYLSTFAFTNDFPALLPANAEAYADHPLLQGSPVRGTCRVLCFSPRHDLTLGQLSAAELHDVIDLWCNQTSELGRAYQWVQVFENRGAMMGASNPHPHGQVWALDALPTEIRKEDAQQRAYHQQHGRSLLLDYAELELTRGERVVVCNDEWLALVPFWAVWPFETLLIPRRPVRRLPDLLPEQRAALGDAVQRLLARYDNLFEAPFPYSMGWHGAPFADDQHTHWQLHAHFFPPLLRSATVRKFLVGFELLCEAQRDLTPEHAAERLRNVADAHYLGRRQ